MRVVAYIPDLLFGSNVLGALDAAGYEVVLVGDPAVLGQELDGAAVLVIDLTADPAQRIETVRRELPEGVRTLAFYSHVESDVRGQALAAGFDQVVPRSRMAREGAALVAGLSEEP